MPSGADKRADFLWMVQTFFMKGDDHLGWRGHVGDAVAASYRIPREKTARDAALDFWQFCTADNADDGLRACPWIADLKDPKYLV